MSESFVGLVAQELFSVKHQFSGKTYVGMNCPLVSSLFALSETH